MNHIMKKQSNIDYTQERIITLITQCIADILQTITSSGLEMRDVGIGIDRYQATADTDIIELKLQTKRDS